MGVGVFFSRKSDRVNCEVYKMICDDCNTLELDVDGMDKHLKTREHQRRCTSFFCPICEIQCSGKDNFFDHINGRKHRQQVIVKMISIHSEAVQSDGIGKMPGLEQYFCQPCGTTLSGNVDQHKKGTLHKQNSRAKGISVKVEDGENVQIVKNYGTATITSIGNSNDIHVHKLEKTPSANTSRTLSSPVVHARTAEAALEPSLAGLNIRSLTEDEHPTLASSHDEESEGVHGRFEEIPDETFSNENENMTRPLNLMDPGPDEPNIFQENRFICNAPLALEKSNVKDGNLSLARMANPKNFDQQASSKLKTFNNVMLTNLE